MQSDPGFSDAAYGVGAGIFFIGYVLFEIPGIPMLPKLGARLTFSRILVLWGVTSAWMLFVRSVPAFYAMRFLLGVFEAGFAPGMIYYLSRWLGQTRMARAIAIVFVAGPLGGGIGGRFRRSRIHRSRASADGARDRRRAIDWIESSAARPLGMSTRSSSVSDRFARRR